MGKLDAFKEIVREGAPASEITWLRLGGSIEFLARPRSENELVALLKECARERLQVRALGEGAGVLVSDVGAPGVVVQLTEPDFCKLEIEGTRVVVGAGLKLGRLATATVAAGLGGLEGLVGVPGSVGAAVATNASTSDASLGQRVESARVAFLDGEVRTLAQDDFLFGYRSSNLANAIILSVAFKLDPEDPTALSKRMQKIWIARKKSTPELQDGEGLARMFKNPRGQSAAELIESAGFSGATIGGAFVCESNPNLVRTSVGCKSEDVKRLLALIQTQANARLGLELERELEIW